MDVGGWYEGQLKPFRTWDKPKKGMVQFGDPIGLEDVIISKMSGGK